MALDGALEEGPRWVKDGRPIWRALRFWGLVISFGVMFAMFVASVFLIGTDVKCHLAAGEPVRLAGSDSLKSVAACMLAFITGHVLGRLLEASGQYPSGAPVYGVRVFLQACIVLMLLVVFILLFYETLALKVLGNTWPITYYVRCAMGLNAPLAGTGAVALSFLLGHWLWYPKP